MTFGPDWLANLFLFTFLFGLVFTIASLLLGFLDIGGLHGLHFGHHHFHIHLNWHDNHPDLHFGGHGSGHADSGAMDGPGFLNMPTLMAFLTWFGGVGYLLKANLGLVGYIALTLAVLCGLLGAGVMFIMLARVLWPMMSQPMSSADFSLPGTSARVVSSIRAGGVGEIVYSKKGTRFTAGARSSDDSAIPKGAHVVILRYERGIAYVQDVETILKSESRSQKSELSA